MHLTWPIISALAGVWAVIAACVILLQRRSAAATLAWLLVLVFLPGVGLVAYRLLGPLRLKRKRLRRRLGRRVVEDALSALESLRAAGTNELQVARVPIAMREAPPLHAHAVDLYLDGAAIVGTANLDNRSFKLDFELCALVFDRQVTGRLADAFEADLTESRAMDEAARAHLSLPRRLGEAGARLLSPLL